MKERNFTKLFKLIHFDESIAKREREKKRKGLIENRFTEKGEGCVK